MGKFSPDTLIYILVIAGILIFNYLAQRAAAKRQTDEAAAGGEPPPAQGDPFEEIFGRRRSVPQEVDLPPETLPAPVRMVEVRPAAVVVEAPRRRLAARGLLTGRQNLQRAIVAMTVLGPCRAMEPPGEAAASASNGQAAR